MRIETFVSRLARRSVDGLAQRIPDIVRTIADGTDTDGLVVVVYLLQRKEVWQAHAYSRPVSARVFEQTGRQWDFVQTFGAPPDLPGRFRLIRMAFGMREPFPRRFEDAYAWRWRCETFDDLLALTFAHELHHFRKYHLGLHPREGEQAACRWALARARTCGFHVEGVRGRARQRRPVPGRRRWSDATLRHFELLRSLPPGAPIRVAHDTGRARCRGGCALKVRNLRRDSYRMAIRTPDGREWHWPMQWLDPLP